MRRLGNKTSAHLGTGFFFSGHNPKKPRVLSPLVREIAADCETPVSLFAKLRPHPPVCLLESVEGGEHIARYSFISYLPFAILRAQDGYVEVQEGRRRIIFKRDPLTVLARFFAQFRVESEEPLPPFVGGAVGCFGYDFVRYYERLPRKAADDLRIPDCYLILSRAVVVFDHVQGLIKIIVLDEKGRRGFSSQGKDLLARLEAQILTALRRPVDLRGRVPAAFQTGRVESNLTRHEFLARVRLAKQYIEAGDIFQVVLSQRMKAPFRGNPFFLYRTLRRVNPSPYLFYLAFPEMQIIGSSPEMLLKCQGNLLITRPLAGTRPRGKNREEDLRLEEELRRCQKERAEHVMLVDLGRNDLGRVSRYGSVTVPVFLEIERYSHVMHLVSEVRGELAPEHTVCDALKAVFPAGTVSGAPKIRAMEIIEELEPQRRGVYAGAVGYLSFTGGLDTCIAIRTILIKDGYFYAQAGAGIVADSEPEREYEETCNKAAALLASLEAGKQPKTIFLQGGTAR